MKNTTISNYTAHGNRTTNFTLSNDMFYDQEGDTISYTYVTSPTATGFISYDASTRELSINVGNDKAGVYEFTLTAKDQYSDTGSTDSKFNITIINNEIPVTTEVFTNTTMLAYYPYELVFNSSEFSDINGDTIRYNMSTNATWITINTTELKFSGSSDNSQVNFYELVLVAYDDYGGENTITYTVNITQNHVPISNGVTIPDPVDIQCMHPFQFDFDDYFTDPDGESLKIEDTNPSLFSWMTIDNSTALMSGSYSTQCSDSGDIYNTYKVWDQYYNYTQIQIKFRYHKDHYPEFNTSYGTALPNITCYEGVL